MGFKVLSLYFVAIFFIIFGAVALKVDAQVSTGILFNLAPTYPAPNEEVSITLNSYAHNLNSVNISWSVDGRTAVSGIGKKSFLTTAPSVGGVSNVIATVYLPDGARETKITIRPSVMILLWQANDSLVPPFYKGKALATPDSEIKIVAMPEIRTSGGLADSNNLTYSWKKDYTNNVDGSGYGKNFFIYVSDYLEDSNTISVTVATTNQQYSNQAMVTVENAQPKILFYNRDSALGTIWEKTLVSPYKIQGPEVIEAVPYFISPKVIQHPMLVWNWFINGSKVSQTDLNKNLMPLQAEEGKHGTSQLKLKIENREKVFQTTEKEINIEF